MTAEAETNVVPLFRRPASYVLVDCWADVIDHRDGYVVGEVGFAPHQWETVQILKNNPDLFLEAVPGGGYALCRIT